MPVSDRERELIERLDAVGRSGFAYACQKLRNREDALDAVQAALTSVWRTRQRLDPQRDLRGWFFRILRNRCIDVVRDRARGAHQTLGSDPVTLDDPADGLARDESRDQLRAALATLTEEQREIVLLRDYHGLSYAEIGRALNIPPGTVMSRLSRARSALRERFLAQEGAS